MKFQNSAALRYGLPALAAIAVLSGCSSGSGEDLSAELMSAEQATVDALASNGAALRVEAEAADLKRRIRGSQANCDIASEIAKSMGNEPTPCGYTGPTEPPAAAPGSREYSMQELMTLMCSARAETDADRDAKPRKIIDVVEVSGSRDDGTATAQVVYTEDGVDGQMVVPVTFSYVDGRWKSCTVTSTPTQYN
ncbi:hypothetical protein GS896_27570 [Rhodococcus hoagii]|nr:hypothetical protein [Prescottella equi]MBM4654012.1 hypothetical protein [Prescottella equi]MBM4719725.1 hypothetical protein [Prescottella equi]NKR23522.1 hypothetical protein [Prescottella equi]NKT56324.1 hypothetical protein [Prescottella equi]